MGAAIQAGIMDGAIQGPEVLSPLQAALLRGFARKKLAEDQGTYTPLMGDTAILQHFAASAAFARTVVEVLNAPTRPWDVILQSRPDIVFSAAVDIAKIRHLFRSAHLASQSASTSSSTGASANRSPFFVDFESAPSSATGDVFAISPG